MHFCPDCENPMAMVGLLARNNDEAQRATFYCRECGFADTAELAGGEALFAATEEVARP